MKFQTSSAFEKHLKASFPQHLSTLFLFVSPSDYEKRLWVELVAEMFRKKKSQLEIIRFQAPEASPRVIQDEVRTPTLWGGARMLIIDAIDQAKSLGGYLELLGCHSCDVILIFCASIAKPVSELYQKCKKEMIVLDVSEEKPWDQERRLQEWMKEQVQKEGKQLSSEMAIEILRVLGTDVCTLDQELKKLITYVGAKTVLERADLDLVCGSKDLVTGWTLAECVVWKQVINLESKVYDLGFLFPFLGQIRYHLQLGAQLADLAERKMAMSDLKRLFPSVRAQNIDKWTHIATQRGSSFFVNGILRLYDFELTAKSTSMDLGIAFDFFQAKLYEKAYSSS